MILFSHSYLAHSWDETLYIHLFTHIIPLCQCFAPSCGISLGNGACGAHPHQRSLTWLISHQLSKMDKPVALLSSPATPAGLAMCLLREGMLEWERGKGVVEQDHPSRCHLLLSPALPTLTYCLSRLHGKALRAGSCVLLSNPAAPYILSSQSRGCREGRTDVAEIRPCSPSSSGSTGPRGSSVAVIDVHPMSVTDMQRGALSVPFPSGQCGCRAANSTTRWGGVRCDVLSAATLKTSSTQQELQLFSQWRNQALLLLLEMHCKSFAESKRGK